MFSLLTVFGPPAVAGRVYEVRSVRLSALPSFRLSGHFPRIVSLVFPKFWHGARYSYEVVRDRAGFSRKLFLPHKLGKWTKNAFLKFIEKSSHKFLLNLLYNENLYHQLCYCKIPYQGKVLLLRYGSKYSQPIRLQDFLINHTSRTNQ